jgi:hypothetical protein
VNERQEETHDSQELIELLNELRVILPGVQVLLAFLLAIPFTQRFEKIGHLEDVYFAALLCTVVGTIVLTAPSAIHRILWRQEHTEKLLRIANRLTITGTIFVGAGITLAIYLVADVIYPWWTGVAAAALTALLIGSLWYALPLARRKRS